MTDQCRHYGHRPLVQRLYDDGSWEGQTQLNPRRTRPRADLRLVCAWCGVELVW